MNRGIKPFLVQSFEFFVQPPQSMCLKVPRCNALQTKRCLQKEGSLTRRCVCGEGFKNKKSDPWSRQTCELANPCGIKSKSCNYGGICKDNTDGQEVDCGCPDGYSGHLCEHLPELCRNFPCGHGYCRISNGIPFCICFKGYKKSQGKECDIEVENYCKIEKGDYTLNVTSFKVNAIANLTCNPGTQLGGKDKRVTSKLMSCVEHSNIHGKVEQKWPTCYRS